MSSMYRKRNVSVKPPPFIDLLILDMINRFMFGHGAVIYYVCSVKHNFFITNITPSIAGIHPSQHGVIGPQLRPLSG